MKELISIFEIDSEKNTSIRVNSIEERDILINWLYDNNYKWNSCDNFKELVYSLEEAFVYKIYQKTKSVSKVAVLVYEQSPAYFSKLVLYSIDDIKELQEKINPINNIINNLEKQLNL